MLRALLIWTLLLSSASAADLSPQHRVKNLGQHGTCWWACAAMIGNVLGIEPLSGLQDAVLETGVGRDHGARQEDISYWMEKLSLTVRSTTERSYEFLTANLEHGPVIVSIPLVRNGKTESHAVLLLEIEKNKRLWRGANGQTFYDRTVRYVDPNEHEITKLMSYSTFQKQWNGRAHAFNPADQVIAKKQSVLDRRLLLAEMGQDGPKVTTGKDAPPMTVPVRAYLQSTAVEVSTSPGNQLADGVRRPLDTFVSPYVDIQFLRR